MQQNALVSIGERNVTGKDANKKVNQAQGSTYGNQNQLLCNLNVNNNHDRVDAIIEDGDVKIANVKQGRLLAVMKTEAFLRFCHLLL